MNRIIKKLLISLVVLICAPSVQAYRKERVVLGQELPFKPTYTVHRVEDGVWVQYAVVLTPFERNTLQRAIKAHIDSDSEFNKRIDEEEINTITSGCRKGRRNQCAIIENVLRDFMGRSYADMFTAVGLSRDI